SIGGGILFRAKVCISCHNPNSGLNVLENLGAKYDVQTLSRFLEKPQPPMPVYPLSAADKEALSVFLIENY
ncbi:MAG: oxidoreductase, partial [Gammaproteobacteria bacterium]|nr:oxidoreductase [Gammaproteobacteria bacterium]